MEIIILKINQYKDSDGIINAISSDLTMSLLKKGLFSPKSKYAFLNSPLNIIDVEMNEGKYKYPMIKEAKLLFTPYKLSADLLYMGVIMSISELTNYLLSDEEKVEIYDYLKNSLYALKEDINPLKVLLAYIAKVLKISGYDFEMNCCIRCSSKKDIVTFSFEEGGFICSNCYSEDIKKLFNKNQLLALREAFLTTNPYINDNNISDDEMLFIINKFKEFIFDSYGINIKSFDLLIK